MGQVLHRGATTPAWDQPEDGGQVEEAVLGSGSAHWAEASPFDGSDCAGRGCHCCFPQAYPAAPR
jgi:hypothetical protein